MDNGNYGGALPRPFVQDVHSGMAGASAPPQIPALEGFRHQMDRIHGNLMEMHEMADRSCGIRGPQPDSVGTSPTAAPNGLLDQIENDLRGLERMSSELVARYRRFAG